MTKAPLEQILTYGERLVAAMKRSLQAHPWMAGGVACALVLACFSTGVTCHMIDRSASGQLEAGQKDLQAEDLQIVFQSEESQGASQSKSSQTMDAQEAFEGKSFLVNGSPLISGDPSSSSIAQRLDKAEAFLQLLGGSAAEGGSAFAQSSDQAAQHVIGRLFITAEALQELPAAASGPATFSLLDGFNAEARGTKSESVENAEDDEASGTSGGASIESNNAEIDLGGLTDAIRSMESSGYEVGCFFMDLNTGVGVAYNLDTRIYGASSFKGIYAAYLSERLADGDAGLSDSARSLMDASVRYSDNNAFSTLRNTYDGSGFASWVESCGVDSDIAHDTHFPRYSARESVLLWFHTYRYLESGTDAANHLHEIYTQTNVSFIREGANEVLTSEQEADEEARKENANGTYADTEASSSTEVYGKTVTQKDEDVVVMNKAGWIASSPRFSGLCDAGIIECDGQTYLMSVMTSAPDSSTHRAQVVSIIEELFKLR